jgi:hypothetical protein
MQYHQRAMQVEVPTQPSADQPGQRTLVLQSVPLDLAFLDDVLEDVKKVWQQITAADEGQGEFLVFEARNGGEGDN